MKTLLCFLVCCSAVSANTIADQFRDSYKNFNEPLINFNELIPNEPSVLSLVNKPTLDKEPIFLAQAEVHRTIETTSVIADSGPACSGPACSGPACSGPACSGPVHQVRYYKPVLRYYKPVYHYRAAPSYSRSVAVSRPAVSRSVAVSRKGRFCLRGNCQ